MGDVTVVIGTYGGQEWHRLARERAIPSVRGQAPYVHAHQATLAEARNAALSMVRTEWVVHLDADDELEPGYIDAMRAGTADVRGPMARYVRPALDVDPPLWQPRVAGHRHDCTAQCLPEGNWLLVGAMCRTELVRQVGGWKDWPVYEDWDLFLRCYLAGASFELIRDAIYRAHARPDSRNRGPDMRFKNDVHRQIVEANMPEAA